MSKTNLHIQKPAPINYNKGNMENINSFSLQNNTLPVDKIQFSRQMIIQPKLEIGNPGDRYEQEADLFADKVMMMNDFSAGKKEKSKQKTFSETISPLIQTSMGGTSEDLVSNSDLENQITNSKNNGSLLPENTRSFMESRFGADFSNVKIHTDSKAVQMNRELNAHAFTNGNNIYFNSGKFNPESYSGRRLLAHELTHVVQQSSTTSASHVAPTIQREEGNESNGAFSFSFNLLPPDLKLKLGSVMLHVNTGSTELSFTKDLMKTTLGYSYGGDLSLGSSGYGFNSKLGFNPSNNQVSLGLGYDKFKLNTSLNPTTNSYGLNLNYGAPLLPMPGELGATMDKGGTAVGNVMGSLGSFKDPISFYNQNSGDVKSIMAAVKAGSSIGEAKQGTFGAGLKFTYNPQSGMLIYGAMQWLF